MLACTPEGLPISRSRVLTPSRRWLFPARICALTACSQAAGGGTSGGLPATSTSSGGATSGGASGGSSTGGACDAGPSPCPAGSSCTLPDAGAGACCADRCVDTGSDPTNCYVCGGACLEGQRCEGSLGCVSPDCTQAVNNATCLLPGGTPGLCCAGACRPQSAFASDPSSCGICGNACPTGAACQQGFCQTACPETPCPAGSACTGSSAFSQCLPTGCSTGGGAPCAVDAGRPGACCANGCTDLLFDPASCGACGQACPTGELCQFGSCLSPAACAPGAFGIPCGRGGGQSGWCCDTACVDLVSDPRNCGQCGNVCPAGEACVEGSCASPDGGDCTASFPCPSGTVCSFATAAPSCLALACGPDAGLCAVGPNSFGLCCGGRCIDPGQDPANCGGCGVACASGLCENLGFTTPAGLPGVCAPARGSQACGGGCVAQGGCPEGSLCLGDLCVLGRCGTALFSACAINGEVGSCCPPADGGPNVCADFTSDPANCGACGNACPTGLACLGGVCGGAGDCAARLGDYCALDAGLGLCCPGGACLPLDAGFCPP